MSNRKNIIQVFEHQTLKAGSESKFTEAHFQALEKYGYHSNEKYFSVGNKRIKFSQYVGVIQVKNLIIEILPKADNLKVDRNTKDKWHDALVSMLRECKKLRINAISNAKLKLKSASVLELYYDAFLSEIEKITREGLKKSYRKVEENLHKMKGKILFSKHISKNHLHKERFITEHTIYDKNNKLNQILLKALLILSKVSANPEQIIRINRLLFHFEGIAESNITASWFKRLAFDRNTARYKQALTLAKLIILKYSPDLKGGNEDITAILFDMNRLYENYIYRKLKILEKDPSIPIKKIKEQPIKPFWENRGVRADILVESDFGNIVIDTKWKILKSFSPSDEDLKQVFVYNLHFNSNLSILLYPKAEFDNSDKKPYKKEDFKNLYCRLGFIDLFNERRKLDKKLGYRIYEDFLKNEIVQ